MLEEIKEKIERIEKALIEFNPEYFRRALCDHRFERIDYQQEFDGKLTGEMRFKPFYCCKKCGKMLDKK